MIEDTLLQELFEWSVQVLRDRAITSVAATAAVTRIDLDDPSRAIVTVKLTALREVVDALDLYLNEDNQSDYVEALRCGDGDRARAIRQGVISIIDNTL